MDAATATIIGGRSEEALVRAAQAGDQAAFEELYARYVRMVHGILLARLPLSEVEDLVQEVFLTALRKLRKLREPKAFGGWLAAIARNRATDYHRSPPQPEPLSDIEVPAGNAGHEYLSEAKRVLQVIHSLPDAYRETLTLRLVEGFTGPEIAERTGLTAASVRVNLHRGMQMLRDALRGEKQ